MNPFVILIIANIVGSFFTSTTFAVLFNVPKNCLVHGGIIGTIGWMGYFALNQYNGSVYAASMLCSFILSILSYYAAKKLKTPTQIFFVPGLIPVVPGVTFFHAIQALMVKEYARAGIIFLDVFYVVLGIASGIGLSSAVFSLRKLFLKIKTA